jgi:hypothetical protein
MYLAELATGRLSIADRFESINPDGGVYRVDLTVF